MAEDEVLYSGILSKKARSTVFLGRRWVSRNMKLLRSKKIEYYDGESKRGEISLQGLVNVVEKSVAEADGMEHAFEISNSIRNDKPLLVSAPSAMEKEKWMKYIRRTIAETWGSASSSARMAQLTESLPFIRKKENDFDYNVEALRVLEEFRRNYSHTLDLSMLANVSKVSAVLDQSDRAKILAVGELAKSQNRGTSSTSGYSILRKQCRKRGNSEFEAMAASGDATRTRRSEASFVIPLRSLSNDIARASIGSMGSEAVRKLRVVEESEAEGRDAASPPNDEGADGCGACDMTEEEVLERAQGAIQCCEEGDAEELRVICDACSEAGSAKGVVECLKTLGLRPLQAAAASGSVSCLKLLLSQPDVFGETGGETKEQKGEEGSETSPQSSHRWAGESSPVHVASSWGQSEALRMLLDLDGRCGSVAAHDDSGRTPLHVAALSGQVSTAEVLLAHPACDPNERSAEGVSPLSFAVSSGSAATVQLLLQKGASIAQTDTMHCADGTSFSVNALHLAAEYGNAEVLQILRGSSPPELLDAVRTDLGWTAAHYSAYSNSTSCLQMCIASGLSAVTGRLPPSSGPGSGGTTPSRAKNGSSSSSSETDEAGAESKSPSGTTTTTTSGGRRVPPSPIGLGNVPLHVACYYGNVDVVSLLLQIPGLHGAQTAGARERDRGEYEGDNRAHAQHVHAMLTAKDSLGRSALHYCAMGDRVDLLESLLRLGVPGVDQAMGDGKGYPPFFLAIMYAQEKVIYYSLKTYEGSLEERHPGCGVSPMQLASTYGVQQIMAGITGREMPAPPLEDLAGRPSYLDYGRLSAAEGSLPALPPTAEESLLFSKEGEEEEEEEEEDEDEDGGGGGGGGGTRDSIPDFDETLRDSFRHPSQKDRDRDSRGEEER